ncbi:MAG: type II toxin-antitoxin system RelE/ParE family toxin [Chloroflexi bacterium]|nr:type II toxin-antitoxin system RelE/ParE family toxin [Chloroflexota bacterium]
MWRVETARTRLKRELRRIPKADLERIGNAVAALAESPFLQGVVQLERNVYRIRVGQYRIIYKVYPDEKIVLIGRIMRRGENTYKRISDLFD